MIPLVERCNHGLHNGILGGCVAAISSGRTRAVSATQSEITASVSAAVLFAHAMTGPL
jgi:hypothetical protein